MADTLSNADTGVGADRGAPTGTSRWQKAVGILGVLVVLWVGNDTYKVIDGDFGGGGGRGGDHGPGPTTPVENEGQEPGTDDGGGHQPPAGGHG
ncbi:MAG: hypothetical protein ACRDZV_00040 [Acidimicrobiia bacterium]